MVDTKTPGDKTLSVPTKTLTLKPRVETGTVRQSFSHGRTKQVVVEKREQGKRTVASAETLVGEERIRELSRMLAGVGESAHARSHAAELLDAGESFKRARAHGPA